MARAVITLRVSETTGPVVAALVVTKAEDQEIMLISAKGQVIRVSLEDFRVVGRNTQGVRIWRDKVEDDYVASLTCLMPQDRGNETPIDEIETDAGSDAPVPVAAGSRNGASAELEDVEDDDEEDEGEE